jgi:hypothetical protein
MYIHTHEGKSNTFPLVIASIKGDPPILMKGKLIRETHLFNKVLHDTEIRTKDSEKTVFFMITLMKQELCGET